MTPLPLRFIGAVRPRLLSPVHIKLFVAIISVTGVIYAAREHSHAAHDHEVAELRERQSGVEAKIDELHAQVLPRIDQRLAQIQTDVDRLTDHLIGREPVARK